MADLTVNVRFSEGFPNARTGLIMPDRRTIITGHDKGLVVASDIETGKFSILDDWQNQKRLCGMRREH